MTHYWNRRDERNKRLLESFHTDHDLEKTAKEFGMRIATAREALKKCGVHFPKSKLRKRGICFQNKEKLLKLFREGHSLSSMAREIGSHNRHVRRFLKEYGLVAAPQILKASKNPNWKGGTLIDKDGYVQVYCPDHPNRRKHTPYVLKHRLVMEKKIGRFLERAEVVHHKDGNPGNNDPDNLVLFSENGEHLAFELKGRVPKWTPEGLDRMKKGIALSAARKREQSRIRKAQHDSL